jgi:hypothetical protein
MPVTMQNSSQTLAAAPRITGSVMYAPVGTALPTSSYATVNSGFTDLGWASEKGLSQKETRSNQNFFGWGGGLINNVQKNYFRTMSFMLYQILNPDVLALAFGHNNVTVTGPTSMNGTEMAVALNPQILDTLSWVFDGYYFTQAGYEALIRLVVPKARVVEIGAFDISSETLSLFDITNMMPFPDQNGNYAYLYVNDGVTTGSVVGGS